MDDNKSNYETYGANAFIKRMTARLRKAIKDKDSHRIQKTILSAQKVLANYRQTMNTDIINEWNKIQAKAHNFRMQNEKSQANIN